MRKSIALRPDQATHSLLPRVAALLLIAAVTVLGAAGTTSATADTAPTAPAVPLADTGLTTAVAPPLPAPAAATPAPAGGEFAVPAAIRALDLREEAPGMSLRIDADRAVVWTSYRDAEGRLVLELPNSVPAATVSDLLPPSGLVSAVEVVAEANADRPLTRLTVATRGEAEHALTAEGNALVLRLLPVGAPATTPTLAYEPISTGLREPSAESAREPAAAPATPSWSGLGTPDAPLAGPAPVSSTATALAAVEVASRDGATVVAVRGDGDFVYSTFQLADPVRFVIDLKGVTNASSASTVAVGGELVERVRVAQFKSSPQPVSRVVFDLRAPVVPVIARTGSGLTLRFGGDAGASPSPMTPATPPPPAELRTLEQDLAAPSPAVASALPSSEPVTVSELPEPAPLPVAMPQPAPAVGPATSDVALFEAAQATPPPPGEQRETVIPSFASKSVTAEKIYVGEPISMSLKDADIKDVLRTFAKISALNIVVQPGVKGSVTVELENVPWDQALDQILKINRLGMELDGNILRIAPVDRLREEAEEAQRLKAAQALSIPLQTVIKKLSYADAGVMANMLSGRGVRFARAGGGSAGFARSGSIISQRGSVAVDGRTNSLIIKELPSNMETVLAVIETIDTPQPQVVIEARIVETTKTFSRTLGIRWSYDGIASPATGNSTGLVFPNNVSSDGQVNLLTGGANGLLNIGLGNILDTFRLDATLQAAENEGLVNILSAPRIATLHNEKASIQSGLQIPVQTIANNTVTVQFVNATLRLEVTPQVTAEGTILLDFSIQKRAPQFALQIQGAPTVPISTKEAKSRVVVRDGGTTVIGGIYEVSTDQGQDRVPGLANVPILGHLFKNRRRLDSNTELLIFITPRVVRL